MLGCIYICPTGIVLRTAFAAISPILNAETRKLIKMVPTCEALHQSIPARELPAHMGGADPWEFDAARDLVAL